MAVSGPYLVNTRFFLMWFLGNNPIGQFIETARMYGPYLFQVCGFGVPGKPIRQDRAASKGGIVPRVRT
jgi:hypothetical protein